LLLNISLLAIAISEMLSGEAAKIAMLDCFQRLRDSPPKLICFAAQSLRQMALVVDF
jgi:hypothetical protein